MKYQKGESGNPAGRPKGATNKATGSLRSRIAALLDENYDQVTKDLGKLDPRDRVNAWIKLVEFVAPKRREQQIVDVSKLTEDQVEELLKKAIEMGGEGVSDDI